MNTGRPRFAVDASADQPLGVDEVGRQRGHASQAERVAQRRVERGGAALREPGEHDAIRGDASPLLARDEVLETLLRGAHAGQVGAQLEIGVEEVVPRGHHVAAVERDRLLRRVGKQKPHARRGRKTERPDHVRPPVAVVAETVEEDDRRIGRLRRLDLDGGQQDEIRHGRFPRARAGAGPVGRTGPRCAIVACSAAGRKRKLRAHTRGASRGLPRRRTGTQEVPRHPKRHDFLRSSLPMASAAPVLREVALDDKYALDSGRVYLTGVQALVRLLILQRQRDALAGLNTGGFVSGYRGSPLGGLDQALWKAAKFLDRAQRQVPAGPQRGPRRHGDLGHAAGQPVPGRQGRRRLRHVVRQGPGRRPLRRRLQARQLRGHLQARRRPRARGRRPRGEVLDPPAPVATTRSRPR